MGKHGKHKATITIDMTPFTVQIVDFTIGDEVYRTTTDLPTGVYSRLDVIIKTYNERMAGDDLHEDFYGALGEAIGCGEVRAREFDEHFLWQIVSFFTMRSLRMYQEMRDAASPSVSLSEADTAQDGAPSPEAAGSLAS